MDCVQPTIFSVGHSSRPLGDFLGLLAASRIECVVDVRRLPGSRAFPQYDAGPLAASLAEMGIAYWHLDALCGRRTTRESAAVTPETFWTNASFARYAAYARGEQFARGLRELIHRASRERCAVMCAEAVWWRCHRRIIADHLIARRVSVQHVMGPGNVEEATLTQGAYVRAEMVVYPQPADIHSAAQTVEIDKEPS